MVSVSIKNNIEKTEEVKLNKRKKMAGWKLVSLASAELAFFFAYLSFSATPISSLINPVFLIPISLIPIFTMFTEKNPFSFEFFGLLITIIFPKIFPSTPLYNSFINALYVLGFEKLAKSIVSIMKPQPTPSLALIVVLFCFAQIVEGKKIQYAGVAFVTVMLAYLLYPLFFTPLKSTYVITMIAVGVAAVAFALFKYT